VLFNDTDATEIVHFDPRSGTVVSRTALPTGFLRGLMRLSRDVVVAGNQNDIYIVDLARRTVVDRLRVADNEKEAVYDIKIIPSGFHPIPPHLLPPPTACRL
jgi:hypothetical protein